MILGLIQVNIVIISAVLDSLDKPRNWRASLMFPSLPIYNIVKSPLQRASCENGTELSKKVIWSLSGHLDHYDVEKNLAGLHMVKFVILSREWGRNCFVETITMLSPARNNPARRPIL